MLAIALLLLILPAGCGNQDRSTAGEPAPQQPEHYLQTQTEALDKARAVEDQVLEAARRQREAIEDETD